MAVAARYPFLWAVVAVLLALASGVALAAGLEVSVRWTVYLLLVPFGFAALFGIKQPVVLMATIFVPLMVLERSLISFREVGPFAVGISLITTTVVIAVLWFRGHRLPPLGNYRWIWLGLIATASLAVLQGRDLPVELVRLQHHYLEGFLYFALALLAWKTPEDVRRFCWVLVGIGVLFAAFQFYFLRTGIAVLQPTFDVASSEREWRYGGPLGNPNSFADFCAMLLTMMLTLTPLERGRFSRIALVAAGAAIISALLLTGSRGGLFAATVGSAVAMFVLTRHILRGWVALPLAVGLFLLGYQIADTQFGETLDKSVERLDRGLEDVRTEIWAATTQIVAKNPWGLGHDPQSFVGEIAKQRPGFFFATPHNLFLGVAASIGILGLLCFLAFWVQLTFDGYHAAARAPDQRTRQITAMVGLFLLVFLVAAMTEPIFDNGHKLNHLFWFMSGTMVWLNHYSKTHAALS